MKLVVNRGACMSIAYCVDEAPKTLGLDSDYISIVIQQDGDPPDKVLNAAKACPVRAIQCFDDDGKQIWPPADEAGDG